MRDEERSVDISGDTKLRTLAEEVQATQEPCTLRRDGEEIARIVPVKPRRKRRYRVPSEADMAAFRAAAGAWKDMDTDKLVEDIYASRDAGLPRPAGRVPTDEEWAALQALAGAWSDVDTDTLKANIRASREVPSRQHEYP
ncbi:MAG: hypothetical protein IT303_20110 [Dehalococcoidia bacterium]|nr:hypothetical protein [Dehalococcoidia bacterium]